MKRWFAAMLAMILALTQLAVGAIAFAEEVYAGDPETPPEAVEFMLGEDPATPESIAVEPDVEISESVEAMDAGVSFTLSSTQLTLMYKAKATLTALDINGSAIAAKKLNFASSNKNVVAVSSKGVLTAKKAGAATIAVKYNDTVQQCVVNVPQAPSRITLSETALKLNPGDTYTDLRVASMLPEGSMTTITWSSSKKSVASVDPKTGAITALKAGTATITAKTLNSVKATCKVTVANVPVKITVSPSSYTLKAPGKTKQLKVSGASKGEVSFTSSDTNVAKVSSNGLITAVNIGIAVITATTYNGKTDTCTVTVEGKPSKLALDPSELSLELGETATLSGTFIYSNGMTQPASKLTFKSSSKSIVTVTSDGRLTPVKAGTATITAKASSLTATCKVTVYGTATSIILDRQSAELNAGSSLTLKATVKPAGSSDVTWESSAPSVAAVSAAGKVTGKATGTAVITAKTGNGLKASCTISVSNWPTGIKISPAKGKLKVGQVGQYVITLTGGTDGDIYFESSDDDIAEVDQEGVVTAIAPGSVTITATTENGISATATLTVSGSSGNTSYTDPRYEEDYTDSNGIIETVIAYAESQLGVPYVHSGGYKDSDPSGFDCSGLVYWAYYQVGIKLKDTPSKMASDSNYTKITHLSDLKRGDVLCFKSDSSSSVNHVALYLGDGKFINASQSKGSVIYGSFTNYYIRNFVCARRIID